MTVRSFCRVVFLAGAVTLWADEGVDGLFDQAPPDTVAEAKSKPDTTALTTAPLSMVGHLNVNSGALVGLNPAGFFSLGTDLAMDARPDPSIRIHGLVVTGLANMGISALSVNELYVDYTLLDAAVFRMGKYTLTWGQGRIFNPGNLVSDSSNGVTFKAFAPVLGQSFTAVVLGNPGLMVNPGVPSWREVSYAGQLSGDLGPMGWGVAGLVRPGAPMAVPQRNGTVFLKTTFFSADVFVEGVVLNSELPAMVSDLHYLAGFFWEGGTLKWQFQGEVTDTRWGSAVRLTGWSLTPVLRWEQSRIDGSGTVAVGVTWNALPHLTIDFGVPWLYGEDNSEYVVNDADPHKQRLGLGVRVTLDSQY